MEASRDSDLGQVSILHKLSYYFRRIIPYIAALICFNAFGFMFSFYLNGIAGSVASEGIIAIFFMASFIALFIALMLFFLGLQKYIKTIFVNNWRTFASVTIIFVIVLAVADYFVIYNSYDPDLTIKIALSASLIYLLSAIRSSKVTKNSYSIEEELKRKINSAYRSAAIALSICAATGVVAIYFARGAIELTEGSSPEIVALVDELTARARAISSLETSGLNVRAIAEDGTIPTSYRIDAIALAAATEQIIDEVNSPIDGIIDDLATQRKIASDSRLIEYRLFSGLFVRIGSIAIVMVVFGIAVGEMKKSIKRAEETRQLIVAVKAIQSPDLDLEKLLRARLAMVVSDTIDEVSEKSVERFATGETTGVLSRVYETMFRKVDTSKNE